jgi:hypothetical protein
MLVDLLSFKTMGQMHKDPGKPLYMLVMKMDEFLAQNSKSYS